MYIHLGSYSGNITSLQGQPGLPSGRGGMGITNSFQASQSSIRSLHRCNKYLLAGGFDEMVYVYNVKQNREQGEINAEQGMVCQITSDGRVLITAGAQGSIKMWKVGKWDLLHQLREHKGQIQSLFVDASGKVMLSVGKDRKLILWNLLKAIRIYDRKLDFDADKVLMTSNMQSIILTGSKQIRVFRTEPFQQLSKLTTQCRFQDTLLFNDHYLVVASDNGQINIYPIPSLTHSVKFKAHNQRVKCLGQLKIGEEHWLVTASSNGEVKVWDVLNLVETMDNITQDYTLGDLKPIESFGLGERWISMTVGQIDTDKPVQQGNQEIVQRQQQEVSEKKPKKIKKIHKGKDQQRPKQVPAKEGDQAKMKNKKKHKKHNNNNSNSN